MNPSRNAPCPCGSGKKYKHCCEAKDKSKGQAAIKMPTVTELNQLLALFNAGHLVEVASQARLLTENFPALAPAWKLLGICLHRQGKGSEALPVLLNAAKLLPNDAEAHYNLGVTQESLGQLKNAIISYRRSIALKPDFPPPYNNMGLSLRGLGQFENAIEAFRRALLLQPAYSGALVNLGATLSSLGKTDEAITYLLKALQYNPNFTAAYISLSITQKSLGQLQNALRNCHQALEINPDYAEAYHELGNVLNDLGQYNQALTNFYRAIEIKPSSTVWRSDLLFILNYNASFNSSDYLNEAKRFGTMVSHTVTSKFVTWTCDLNPKRLRVGIVSGDLRNHAVSFFLESVLTHLNSSKIELFAYHNNHVEDELTTRIKPFFLKWLNVCGVSDPDMAQLIYTDGIHILIDLSGHTIHNRLPVFA